VIKFDPEWESLGDFLPHRLHRVKMVTCPKLGMRMDLDELNRHISKIIEEQNRKAVQSFEGYSPEDMNAILYDTFGPNSPLQIQKLSASDYLKIPMLNLVKYLCHEVEKSGQVKLTAKGFLPTKMVKDLYGQGFIAEEFIESGHYKLYKETDAESVHLAKILVELSGIAKKRLGKLSLTKAGKKVVQDDFELLKLLIDTFRNKFNWGYFDGYEQVPIGPLGFGFTLILLSKYGKEKRRDTFYAEKYFEAFPLLLQDLQPTWDTLAEYGARCYSIRTFDRFLKFFALVEIEDEGNMLDDLKYIQKTELLDNLVKVAPPKR
jgi:hypothetical protein